MAADNGFVLELIAFVDREHETTGSCTPEPGVDCVDWCDACRALSGVPADLLAAVRSERGAS